MCSKKGSCLYSGAYKNLFCMAVFNHLRWSPYHDLSYEEAMAYVSQLDYEPAQYPDDRWLQVNESEDNEREIKGLKKEPDDRSEESEGAAEVPSRKRRRQTREERSSTPGPSMRPKPPAHAPAAGILGTQRVPRPPRALPAPSHFDDKRYPDVVLRHGEAKQLLDKVPRAIGNVKQAENACHAAAKAFRHEATALEEVETHLEDLVSPGENLACFTHPR